MWVEGGLVNSAAEAILEVAIRKRKEVIKRIEAIRSLGLEEFVRDSWVQVDIKSVNPPSVAGVDGGSGRVDFQGFTLYGVTGVATNYSGFNSSKYLIRSTYVLADVDILTPPKVMGRVDLYREIMEGKVGTLTVVSGTYLVLMDGSLKSILITPTPLAGEALPTAMRKALNYFGNEVFIKLREVLSSTLGDYELLRKSPLAYREVLKDHVLAGEDLFPAVVFIEYVEKLEVFRRLLANALLLKGSKVIFISKSGRSQTYFSDLSKKLGRELPADITLFQYLTRGAGYAVPKLDPRPIKYMPGISYLKEFYMKVRVAETYVRLEDGGPVLKVEVPYVGDSVTNSRLEADIKSLLPLLKAISPKGYPYPLLEAHEVSHVSRSVLSEVAHAYGLTPYSTGREVVEEWLI